LELACSLLQVLDALYVGIVDYGGSRLLCIFKLAEGRVGEGLVLVLHLLARFLLVGVPVGLELVGNFLHGIKRSGGGSDQLQSMLLGLTWR
jgi:hypothetical protein